MKLYDDPVQEEMIWKVREGGLGSTAWIPDSATPGRVGKIPRYRWKRCPIICVNCVVCSANTSITLHFMGTWARDAFTVASSSTFIPHPGIDKYRRFMAEAVELVVVSAACIGRAR